MIKQFYNGRNFILQMGWTFLSIIKGSEKFIFPISPMYGEPDILYVSKDEDLKDIFSNMVWNRDIRIMENDFIPEVISIDESEIKEGSLESTPAGQEFLRLELFNPDCSIGKIQVHEMWCNLEKRFADNVTGKVTIYAGNVLENSVFNKISIPTLLENDKVFLNFVDGIEN